MGFLSAITAIASEVLPHAIRFFKGGVREVVSNLDGDLAGVDVTMNPTVASRFHLGSLSSPVMGVISPMSDPRNIQKILTRIASGMLDDNDRKGEEVLVVTHEELERRQVLEAMMEYIQQK